MKKNPHQDGCTWATREPDSDRDKFTDKNCSQWVREKLQFPDKRVSGIPPPHQTSFGPSLTHELRKTDATTEINFLLFTFLFLWGVMASLPKWSNYTNERLSDKKANTKHSGWKKNTLIFCVTQVCFFHEYPWWTMARQHADNTTRPSPSWCAFQFAWSCAKAVSSVVRLWKKHQEIKIMTCMCWKTLHFIFKFQQERCSPLEYEKDRNADKNYTSLIFTTAISSKCFRITASTRLGLFTSTKASFRHFSPLLFFPRPSWVLYQQWSIS